MKYLSLLPAIFIYSWLTVTSFYRFYYHDHDDDGIEVAWFLATMGIAIILPALVLWPKPSPSSPWFASDSLCEHHLKYEREIRIDSSDKNSQDFWVLVQGSGATSTKFYMCYFK